MSTAEAFWQESRPGHRRLLLDEAAGRDSGAVTFQFDTEDVLLDFDAGTATVTDVTGQDASETVPLREFLDRAAAFADDPAHGDGLTGLRRNPPSFRVGTEGSVEPAS